jgi:hypothetical protein
VPWRDADFRRLWAGQAASQLGEQASLIVLPLIAVLTLNADATELGALALMALSPLARLGRVLPAGSHQVHARSLPSPRDADHA